MRILKEALGMRALGHEVVFAVSKGGGLVAKARAQGFTVYELLFHKKRILGALYTLIRIFRKHRIDILSTHSSLDAWIAACAARLMRKKVVRTRHLSTAIRKGLNSKLLYSYLADFVVTTSTSAATLIAKQAHIPQNRCIPVATGVDISQLCVEQEAVRRIRSELKLKEGDLLVGTACFVRSWKGIQDLMQAAHILKDRKDIRWLIVGGGHVQDYKALARSLELEDVLTFTGHLEFPYAPIAAMDIFALVSTAHEGISQASLQAAYLRRPLITTSVGGLPEVCIDGKTGLVVPPFSPECIVDAVLKLKNDPELRVRMGEAARKLVLENFTLAHTLEKMHTIYQHVLDEG